MPSPFPGMNPYIEKPSVWQDFRARFVVTAAEQLGQQVEPRHFVRIDRYAVPDEFTTHERHRFLEIRDRDSMDVVTVVELLSPSNKTPGKGREEYWSKIRGLLRTTRTAVVEIDLLRGGPRLPWEQLPPCDYYALVSRPADRLRDPPRAAVWPVRLRDPLPVVPIPLAPGEPEVKLDLQSLLHDIYDRARYRYSLYRTPPEPPLAPADAAWAAQFLPPGGA